MFWHHYQNKHAKTSEGNEPRHEIYCFCTLLFLLDSVGIRKSLIPSHLSVSLSHYKIVIENNTLCALNESQNSPLHGQTFVSVI